jgi:hypothetical protein
VHIGLDQHEAIARKADELLQYRSLTEHSKRPNPVAFVQIVRRTGDGL